MSLGRAFFAARATSVVGTLERARDDEASLFFSAFYGALGGGATVGEAMTAAKRERIRQGSRPAAWATWCCSGMRRPVRGRGRPGSSTPPSSPGPSSRCGPRGRAMLASPAWTPRARVGTNPVPERSRDERFPACCPGGAEEPAVDAAARVREIQAVERSWRRRGDVASLPPARGGPGGEEATSRSPPRPSSRVEVEGRAP